MHDPLEAMSKLLSISRHEFLNSLQVVGGLAQLNKTERLMAYIRKISEEIQQLGRLCACGDPRLALLIYEYFCQQMQSGLIIQVCGTMPLLPNVILEGLAEIFAAFKSSLAVSGECTVTLVLLADNKPELHLQVLGELEKPWDYSPLLAIARRREIPAQMDKRENRLKLFVDKLPTEGEK